MGRPRHPLKELEALLRQAEKQGWQVTKQGRYFKMKCPCGSHKKMVHLTPGRNYERNCRQLLGRTTCWKEDQ